MGHPGPDWHTRGGGGDPGCLGYLQFVAIVFVIGWLLSSTGPCSYDYSKPAPKNEGIVTVDDFPPGTFDPVNLPRESP